MFHISSSRDLSSHEAKKLYDVIYNSVLNTNFYIASSDVPIRFRSSTDKTQFAAMLVNVQNEENDDEVFTTVGNIASHKKMSMANIEGAQYNKIQLMSSNPSVDWHGQLPIEIFIRQLEDLVSEALNTHPYVQDNDLIVTPDIEIDGEYTDDKMADVILNVNIQAC